MPNLRSMLMKFHFLIFLVGMYSICCPLRLCQAAVTIPSGVVDTATAPVELVVQSSHTGTIIAMALSKSGTHPLLVTAGENETVRLWELDSGSAIRRFDGHKGIEKVALSEDGKFLVTGSKDATTGLWDTASGRKILQIKAHTKALTAVAISPDASYWLTGSRDKTVRQWKAIDGSPVQTLAGFPGEISAIAVSSDGRFALIGSKTIAQLRNLEQEGRLVQSFNGHTGGVSAVAISPDGRLALTGSLDKTARLWDVSNGQEIHPFKGHHQKIEAVAFSGDSKTIATGSVDGTIRLWDVESKEKKMVLSLELRQDGTIQVRNLKTKTKNQVISEVIKPVVRNVAFSPDDESIIFSAENFAGTWSLEKGSLIRSFTGNSDLVSSVSFSPKENLILIGSHDNSAYLWDAVKGMQIHRLQGHNADVRAVTFSPDGNFILTGGRDNARLWHADDGTEVRYFRKQEGGVRPVAFSPRSGRYILTGGDDGTARLWDRERGFKEVCNFDPYKEKRESGKLLRNRITTAAFSPDGRRVITSNSAEFSLDSANGPTSNTSENLIRLWERNGDQWDSKSEGKEPRKFEGHDKQVFAIAFSPKGDLVVSGSMDMTMRVWDVASGTQIYKKDHPAGVIAAVFSQDGRYIFSGCLDGIVRRWDTLTGAELGRFKGHTDGIWQVALSQNQRFMLSASKDQTVRLWDITKGIELCKLINFRDGSWAVVDKDGRFDASNGGDIQGLHWAVGNEIIALHQLKARYYEPGLLAKVLKFNEEPLCDVSSFTEVALYPAIKLRQPTAEDPTLGVKLTNRGGGIGKVIFSIHGKEVTADARGRGVDPEAESLDISVNLANHPHLIPGTDNVIEVRALNAEGYLSSRGVTVFYRPPGEAPSQRPTLWAIVAGVSDYMGERIDLRYAAKDAQDMAKALKLGATRLFGAERVHLTLLSKTKSGKLPTKARIKAAVEQTRASRPWDILVVYLAGHGVAMGDTYYYLTQEARLTDLTDPKIRAKAAISSEEMVSWLKKSPARKQVMVLDTCAAGTAARKLVEQRNLSSDQIRAIERLKDRTGFHVLMGSAADAVSYEATQYEQGLLTHALLQGMRGPALREEQYVDVSRLFQYAADVVPTLASNIGGIQRPRIAAPRGTSFDIGLLKEEDRRLIVPSQSKPMLLAPVLLNLEEGFDNLELTGRIRQHLREEAYASLRGAPRRLTFVYVDADQLAGAIRPSGTYRIQENNVRVGLVLVKDGKKLTKVHVQGTQANLEALTKKIVEKVSQAVGQLQ